MKRSKTFRKKEMISTRKQLKQQLKATLKVEKLYLELAVTEEQWTRRKRARFQRLELQPPRAHSHCKMQAHTRDASLFANWHLFWHSFENELIAESSEWSRLFLASRLRLFPLQARHMRNIENSSCHYPGLTFLNRLFWIIRNFLYSKHDHKNISKIHSFKFLSSSVKRWRFWLCEVLENRFDRASPRKIVV